MSVSRRELVRAGAGLGMVVALTPAIGRDDGNDTRLELQLAGYPFEHVRPLISGDANISNARVSFRPGKIGDLNRHVFAGPRRLDVTEIGLVPYILAHANEDFRAYSLVPVFPLRTFRHKSIFIHADAGINEPSDLKGRRVATPGYSSTSLTWIRGMLQDEYGVSPDDIEWVISAQDSSTAAGGNASAQEQVLPAGLTTRRGPAGKDESDLLIDRDVDALFHAAEPRAFIEGHPKVQRLFPDPRSAEQDYYARTGIFPIMHAVAVRRELIDEYPWLPKAVFGGYSAAKQKAYGEMTGKWFLRTLPWFAQELDATTELMGSNFWPYGIERNRKPLETLFRYAHEQGLAQRELEIGEVFEASTLELMEA